MFIESYKFSLKTSKREEFIEITSQLNEFILKTKGIKGYVKIFIPHSTAGVFVNQNVNPDVLRDFTTLFNEYIPHDLLVNVEGNSDAHFKSTLVGVSLEIPFTNQKMDLGVWQGVFFAEFDGPRTRNVQVQIWAI